jgi:hypothetical protein
MFGGGCGVKYKVEVFNGERLIDDNTLSDRYACVEWARSVWTNEFDDISGRVIKINGEEVEE